MTIFGDELLLRTLALFFAAQLLHVAVWRWRRPHGYLIWFLIYWVAVPFILLLVWWVSTSAFYGWRIDSHDAVVWTGALIGYLALCGVYISMFPAIAQSSISLEILRSLHRSRESGIEVSQIAVPSGSNTAMLRTRIGNLIQAGMIAQAGEALELTRNGRRLALVVERFRKLMNVQPSAGG